MDVIRGRHFGSGLRSRQVEEIEQIRRNAATIRDLLCQISDKRQ